MDPITAGMNLLSSLNSLATAIIQKSPPENVGEIITNHEQRINKISAWLEQKFKFLHVDAPPAPPASK